MPKLKKTIEFETAFGVYTANELLGEGGAGRVYGGVDADQALVGIKVLAEERATKDKRRRFRNELAFLQRNKHPNIVTVIDHGTIRGTEATGSFYVMRRYDGSLRELAKNGIAPEQVLPLFSQILDGVEAAHLQGVVHRDLKPENILYTSRPDTMAIADFGVARFTEDLLVTQVVTGPAQRLANVLYAAPEQRIPGATVSLTADIYALGLMLNEMFTGTVPHGTGYRLIGDVAPNWKFLDAIIETMMRQAPDSRPASIAEIKRVVQQSSYEAVSLQRLSAIDGTVIRASESDDPLATTPPALLSVDWNQGELTLILDRPVTRPWIEAFYQMNGVTSILGRGPQTFRFEWDKAFVSAPDYQVQSMVDYFKTWLPAATRTLNQILTQKAREKDAAAREQLRQKREIEEQRLRVLKQIRI